MGSENKLMHARQEEVFFFPTATALGVFRLHDGWAVYNNFGRLKRFRRHLTALSHAERLASNACRAGQQVNFLVQDANTLDVRAWLANAVHYERSW